MVTMMWQWIVVTMIGWFLGSVPPMGLALSSSSSGSRTPTRRRQQPPSSSSSPKKKKKKKAAAQQPAALLEQTKSISKKEARHFLRLRVVSVQQSPSSSFSPVATLSQSDAELIRVNSLDEVLILAQNADIASIVRCAIVKVHVRSAKDEQSPSHATTPLSKSPHLGGRNAKALLKGNLQIQPFSFMDFLWSEELKEVSSSTRNEEGKGTSPATPQRSNIVGTNASSFSFNNFVTEHNLSTPSPRHAGKAATSEQQSKSKRFAWILPVDSNLGDRILASALPTQIAETIHLETIVASTSGSSSRANFPSSCLPVLECLVKAMHMQRFVQVGDPIAVSFQGRSLQLRVTGVTPTRIATNDDDIESAQKQLFQLNLGNDQDSSGSASQDNSGSAGDHELPSTDEYGDDIEARLVWNARNLDASLYQICPRTTVRLVDCSKMSSEPNVTAKSYAIASPPKQYFAGLTTVVQHVRERLLVPLTKSHLFAHSPHLSPPKGLLLHGPSGVGKTCLAKQIAGELAQYKCDVEFVNCVSLQSKTSVVGEAERQLTSHFRPSSSGPKLLILDDIHLICSKRGGINSTGSTDQIAATLLALLDGGRTGQNSNPMAILALTNDASSLDPALRRPGRLDYEVEVPISNEPAERAEILKFHAGNSTAITDSDYLELAKLAKGFNGADCLLAVKEAVRLAIQKYTVGEPFKLTKSNLTKAIKMIRPSAIKAVTVEIPQVLWTHIGGMEHVKRQLREAIELPLAHHEIYQKLHIPPPRGILLYGPPGTGKTMIARALATEGKMNFLTVKGPEVLSKWLGESERMLASLFRRARMASPSIIFFDEIDAIAAKRGTSDSSGGSRILSQLLTELDGVVTTGIDDMNCTQQSVVVIGATNRPDLLDSALTRPGRIDRMVYVGLPDERSREKVFAVALKGRSCHLDVNIQELANDHISKGFSGAELVGICREAALLALDDCFENNESNPSIKMDHILRAIQSTQKQITQEMLDFYTSFRESG
mmetsp:Transcript_18705/g.51194  ORF Transcript_18705/g.51194 Transcript_18705/m.51194 type:complete len:1002 (-) Transcript_18705:73-3078(-)